MLLFVYFNEFLSWCISMWMSQYLVVCIVVCVAIFIRIFWALLASCTARVNKLIMRIVGCKFHIYEVCLAIDALGQISNKIYEGEHVLIASDYRWRNWDKLTSWNSGQAIAFTFTQMSLRRGGMDLSYFSRYRLNNRTDQALHKIYLIRKVQRPHLVRWRCDSQRVWVFNGFRLRRLIES